MLLGLAAQYMAKPKEIDPQKVMDMGTSPHNAELYQRSQDIMDINSDFNQDHFRNMNSAVQDNTYTANRINKMNMLKSGMGGQTGLLNASVADNLQDSNVSLQSNFENFVRNNMSTSNNLLSQVTTNDMQVRDNAVSAYGQNINNKNNWMASMAGNVTKMAGMPFEMASKGAEMAPAAMMLCDANMKENIKKIGTAKTKSGKSVGIYNYNYKGRNKKKTGIIAQDVQRNHPNSVKKGKNGKLYVNVSELF